jgi:hypothetical protein
MAASHIFEIHTIVTQSIKGCQLKRSFPQELGGSGLSLNVQMVVFKRRVETIANEEFQRVGCNVSPAVGAVFFPRCNLVGKQRYECRAAMAFARLIGFVVRALLFWLGCSLDLVQCEWRRTCAFMKSAL